MRKLNSLVMAVALAVGATSLVHAAEQQQTPPPPTEQAGKPHPKPPRHGNPMHEMFKGLDLTKEQKEQMRTIVKEAHQEVKRPSIEDRRALHAIIASDKFDAAKADAQATTMAADSKARALNMMATQNKLYNILTTEQKKQYNERFEKRLQEKPEQPHDKPPVDAP
ncbi:MAG: Periplasmic chaperone Spy [Candidatus Erwinia impunctatus]|nr:Periplasmic chaperone Spy [Culicoides impunctatus]